MKRKYPITFFVLGVFLNLIRYFLICLIGLVIIIIGIISFPICKTIGLAIIAFYLLLSIIDQLFIRSASLNESDDQEFNQFMDAAFGVDDDNALSAHERVMKVAEDKIKLQDNDMDDKD